MEKGKEYILFLKQIKNALYSDSEYVYIPYNMTYGKYECNESRCFLFDADLIESGNLQYSNVNCEIMLSEKKC